MAPTSLPQVAIASQSFLEDAIASIFRGANIVTNVKKEASLKNSVTQDYFEIDIWIPDLALCFEFQDTYHYITTWYSQLSLKSIQQKDDLKYSKVTHEGSTLILVPFWWNSTYASLISTIHFHRPDLFKDDTDTIPISLNPSGAFFASCVIPDVRQLMLASFVAYASTFAKSMSQQNAWWLGEKYDGVRFVWNRNKSKFYARRGQEIILHNEKYNTICQRDTSVFYDGEIWCGRGAFMDSLKMISCQDATLDNTRCVVFDDAAPNSVDHSFEQRYKQLLASIRINHEFIILAARILCVDPLILHKLLPMIIEDGGEGMIIRKTGSHYISGRSDSLVKLKAVRADAEALVIEVQDEEISLKLRNGKTFEILREDIDVSLQLKEGDVVTFQYDSFSRHDIPVNACVTRVRSDVSWEEILLDFEKQNVLNGAEHSCGDFKAKPLRFWTSHEGKNARNLFEEIAKRRQLDPLVADTWYSLARYELENEKGVRSIFEQSGGYIKALQRIFPEISFDERKFANISQGFWGDIKNRRDLFISFAKSHGFDPLFATSWYGFSQPDFIAEKGFKSVLQYYDGNAIEALIHLFPNVEFDRSKFVIPHGHWSHVKNRKLFFDEFANENKFDWKLPHNWYKITRNDLIHKSKNAIAVLKYYNNSFATALMDVYPHLNFKPNKFSIPPRGLWTNKQNRKMFFDTFAQDNNFDPLTTTNWIKISLEKIKSQKGYKAVMQYYHGDYVAALIDCYPSLHLQKSDFTVLSNVDWANVHNRKGFFIAFAQDSGFDPLSPDNWYSISEAKLGGRKYATAVLSYYGGSYKTALCKLFPSIGLDFGKQVS